MTGEKCSEEGTDPRVIKRSGRKVGTAPGQGQRGSSALLVGLGHPYNLPVLFRMVVWLESPHLPQSWSRFVRLRSQIPTTPYLSDLKGTRNIFMSYQESSLLVRRTGRRWLLVTWSESLLFWLLFGMAQPIQLDLPSPPHSPRGVVTMGIVTARSLPHPPYRRVSKGPNILTKILQKGPKISQKGHSPCRRTRLLLCIIPSPFNGRGPG